MAKLSDSLKEVIEALTANRDAINSLKDIEGAEALTQLTSAFYNFSRIDWENFGDSAAQGLKDFANLGTDIASAAKALSGLSEDSIAHSQAFAELSSALAIFSEIDWLGVTKGAVMMTMLPGLLNLAADGFKAAGQAVDGLAASKDSFEALGELLTAFREFADIKWIQVTKGLLVMKMISPLFSSFGVAVKKLGEALDESAKTIKTFGAFVSALDTFSKISWAKVIFGVAMMKIFGGAFEAMTSKSHALKEGASIFVNVAESMGKAIGRFFAAIPFMAVAKGLILLAGLAIDLGLLAGAFILFSKVNWKDVGQGLLAMALFSAVALALGAAWELLVPGLLVLAGLGAALLVFGASLMVVGKGLQFLADGIKSIGDTIPNLADSFTQMAQISGGLVKTAGPLAILSAAIVAFSAATAAGGLVGAVGGAVSGVLNFLSGAKSTNPIDQIARLASMGDALNITATALERINAAIGDMPSTAGVDLAIGSTQGAQLASQKAMLATGGAGGGGGTNASVKNVSNKVSTTIVNNSFMPDRSTALVLAPAM